MRIEERKLTELKPAPYNPRKIDKAALDGLTKSVERFGMVEPIIWNERTGNVVGGHQRLKALQKLKSKTTSVVVIDLDETEEKALNLSLNNPHIAATFDDSLDALLSELRAVDDALLTDLRLDLLDIDFGDAPESVQENIEHLESVKAQRAHGNAEVMEKNDTERYLVIVYPSRRAREEAVAALGLPEDERYVDASSVQISLRSRAASHPATAAAPKNKAGAVG